MLSEVTIAGFQSFDSPQSIALDPQLTLLAGRNDVGKSATLRALRCMVEAQDGIRPNFRLRYFWVFPVDELLRLLGASDDLKDWLLQKPSHTVSADFVATKNASLQPNDILCSEVRLKELDAHCGQDANTQRGWTGSPWGGTTTHSERFFDAARSLATAVSYVGPRSPQLSRQALLPTRALEPDASNLMQVVLYLVNSERSETFANVERFMRQAFPQVHTIDVPLADVRVETSGGAVGELHVNYVGRSDAVPLRLCGTGVQQMLALAVGVLTAREPRLFLIDEPQAYLHPDAERSLLALLAENEQHQYLVTTHSAYLLAARPLRQARLLTLQQGHTVVSHPASAEDVLSELGVTAADLWLAESILWVEGVSDAQVVSEIARTEWPDASRNLRIRAVPQPSRLSRNKGQAHAAYEFCRAVTEAVAPMEVRVKFLFDSDEKSDELRDRIREASHDQAAFLPVRELENLFLDAGAIHQVLGALCERLSLPIPTLDEIKEALTEAIADTSDRDLYPSGVPARGEEAIRIVGSRVLKRLWSRFANAEYEKVADGVALTRALLSLKASALAPLLDTIRELLDSSEQLG